MILMPFSRGLSLVFGLLILTGCATAPAPQSNSQTAESMSETTRAPEGFALSTRLSRIDAAAPAATASSGTAPAAALPMLTVASGKTPPLLDLTVPPDELWQRVRNGFGMPDLHDPRVAERQSWYLNRPDMLRRIFERGRRYLYHIVGELEKRGMPTELALLPMVESAYNPQAISTARAMGLWQFIPSTGKNYDLEQNWWVDERRDIIASTDAALRYLQNVYDMHGDWHLALASYNWGEYAVARAIAKNQVKGLPTDYASLSMPDETRYYVPKLQALKNIIANPEAFGFRLTPLSNQPYFETVMKPELMDVAVAAKLAEIPLDEFISLNPAYHRPVMNGDHGGPLVLPAEKVDTYLANLERYATQDIPLSNWLTYRMASGDTLGKVAARHKISEARLRQINGITGKVKPSPGFNLLVPRPGSLASTDAMARALPRPGPEKAGKKPAKGGKASKPGKAAPKGKAARPASKTSAKAATKANTKSAAKPANKPPTKPTAKKAPPKQ